MNNPLVSIIIPTYNRAHLISETLDSILSQTYVNWECIIVDDGSTDDSESVVGRYLIKDARFQYHHRPKNRPKGANSCRNYGFELSKGKYVNWFDSDDIMLEGFLLAHLIILTKNNLSVSICKLMVFKDISSNVIYKSKMKVGDEESILKDYISGDLNIGTPSAVWLRATVVNYKFDITLYRAQELKFIFDVMSSQKIKFELIDNYLLLVRHHNQSITFDYENKKLSHLLSEIKVRRETLFYAKNNNWENYYYEKSLKLYLKPFKELYINYSIYKTIKEFKMLSKIFIDKTNCYGWQIKFLFFLLIFKLTKRGYRLNRHFHLLEKLN